ncbi:MAG: sporulation membrane protein YtaF [Peptococcaceae bacterium]|nr:sporulation membrane protein YtaF [Peptococcaceae bacterium]
MEKLHLLIMLLLALSSNLDNLLISISCGARKINIPPATNLLIAVITGAVTLAAMLAGKFIHGFIHPWYANYLGSLLIVFSGIRIFINEMLKTCAYTAGYKRDPISASKKQPAFCQLFNYRSVNFFNRYRTVSLKEGFFLGLALALNNLANGIGAGLTGLSHIPTPLFVAAFSLISIWLGLKIGYNCLSRLPVGLAGPASGALLILIGLFEMFY